MRRTRVLSVILLAAALVLAGCSSGPNPVTVQKPAETPTVKGTERARAAADPFVFGAAGDLGANKATARGLAKLDSSNAEFFLALGDLDYDQTDSDAAWCDYVTSRLPTKGAGFPFQLVSGNHEADTGRDGRIGRFADCLRDRLDSQGTYGAQYSFTYPAASPLAKVVMISPRLKIEGHTYRYGEGRPDRRWLVGQIRSARKAGIPWVIVAMHYPCLSTGAAHSGCSSGAAVMNLLLREKVDLVLTGHNHIYERSKQIRLGYGCSRVRPGRYNATCVKDHGSDGRYTAGRGTVQVTSGRFGGRPQGVNPDDPDRKWMVVSGGRTTGWTRFKVSASQIRARYVNTGGPTQDSFVINR